MPCLAKRPNCLFSLFLFLGTILLPAAVNAAPAIPENSLVQACSAMLMDLDSKEILFEQNAHEPIPPASLTKVLSLFVALDSIDQGRATLDTPVVISQHAAQTDGSRMGLIQGETVPLKDLFMGMAVSSGNDASMAVAEFTGGDEANFVSLMNAKARSLGMTESCFVNPNGLPAEGQYTTAHDMLVLAAAYLQAHPEMLEYHNTHILRHGQAITWNKNPLLGNFAGADGLKTGWIKKSGYNIVLTAQRNGRRLLAVILGAPDPLTRAKECCRMLEAGFTTCFTGLDFTTALADTPSEVFNPDLRLTAREAYATWPWHIQRGKNARLRGGRHGRRERITSASPAQPRQQHIGHTAQRHTKNSLL